MAFIGEDKRVIKLLIQKTLWCEDIAQDGPLELWRNLYVRLTVSILFVRYIYIYIYTYTREFLNSPWRIRIYVLQDRSFCLWLCSGHLPIIPAHHTFAASVLHSLKLAVESVFVRCITVTYMCQPQGQNLANVVLTLLHRESGTPCHSISVLLPSAENSSGLGSKPTSLRAPTHDSPPRTIEECNYLHTYLLTSLWTFCQLTKHNTAY